MNLGINLERLFGRFSLGAALNARDQPRNRVDIAYLQTVIKNCITLGKQLEASVVVHETRAREVADVARRTFPGFVVTIKDGVNSMVWIVVSEPRS